jgi:hypothetical protein
MKTINNLKLFKFSLDNPEPIIDESYLQETELLISENPDNPTELMQQNSDLIESLSAYSFATKNKNETTKRQVIKHIATILENKNINYSEFVSFWSVVDISYSVYEQLKKEDQLDILKGIIEKYIKFRHNLYLKYGYSNTTIQVSKDAKTHKQGGNLGVTKISKILDKNGFQKANTETMEDFTKEDKKYIEADKKGKKLFKELLKYYKIKFLWSTGKERKMPDLLIRYKRHIFILEHKHKKEGGGGQNGQINEILSLISFKEKEKNIHFVSFLDGVYFNSFAKKDLKDGKILTQLNNIKESLKHNKTNYFVNTAGFKKLISEFK